MIFKALTSRITMIAAAGTILLGGVLFGIFSYLHNEIEDLSRENQNLEIQLSETTNALDQLESDLVILEEELRRVNLDFNRIQEQNQTVARMIEDLNIGEIVDRDPSEAESIVNKTTQSSLRCFELVSGSDLTEEERNAETPEEFNPNCPWIFDDYRMRE